MTSPSPQLESRWPHRMAVLLVCATFPLIWVGGLVTTYDAGMAVPDWPNTYGYNLFLYPWQTWLAGPYNLFIEHGHRLLAVLVGMIVIALVFIVFQFDGRRWMRYAALGALALVVLQGALGGARVLFDERQLALVHGCVGPLFFAYAVALAAFTSQVWKCSPLAPREDAPRLAKRDDDGTRSVPTTLGRLHILSGATMLLAFAQLVIGANLRHVSIAASPGFFRAMLLFHLLVAGLLAGHVIFLAVEVLRKHRGHSALVRPAVGLCALLAVQLALGSATWVVKYGWPDWFAGYAFAEHYVIASDSLWQALTVTAHVATGSLILGTSTLLSLRAVRLTRCVPSNNRVIGNSRGRWLFFGPCDFQFNTRRPKTQARPPEHSISSRPAVASGASASESRPKRHGVGSRFSASAFSVGLCKDRKRLADPCPGGAA